jgi:hypothetical protein
MAQKSFSTAQWQGTGTREKKEVRERKRAISQFVPNTESLQPAQRREKREHESVKGPEVSQVREK